MLTPIAMGKVSASGRILKATPGISISTRISPGNLFGSNHAGGYTVRLPARLVRDGNYIVQLTAENYGEDGPDHVLTSIALRNQSTRGFEVLIWADRIQTVSGYSLTTVRSNWHFVIYDI